MFINEGTNIIITFLAAKAVIDGTMTLGMMLAVQYIIGQLNAPITGMIQFVYDLQDAKISLERLGEIHQKENEEDEFVSSALSYSEDKSLSVENITFHYEGPQSPKVLDNISLEIPRAKVTA